MLRDRFAGLAVASSVISVVVLAVPAFAQSNIGLPRLDDVNLRALAAVPASGVYGCHGRDEVFETIRAVRAGLAAATEVRRHGA